MDRISWQSLKQYLAKSITPQAEEIDQRSSALANAFEGLGDRQLLALRVPTSLGGSGASLASYYEATVEMSAASGALAFLQTQHQSAASRIAKDGNRHLRTLLPKMASGQARIGVGFSHLRRQGSPMVQATPSGDGFRLTGTIPWVTGYSFFHQAIAGATLPDGAELYGLIPLENSKQAHNGSLTCSQPLPLAAMAVSQTVSVNLENWELEPDAILAIKPRGNIHQGDRQRVLHHGFFALGCALGSLQFLREQKYTATVDLDNARQSLQDKMFAALEHQEPEKFQYNCQLRLDAIQIAQQYACLALAWAGGSGNLLRSPAQRLYREAMMFSIFGQTQTIRNSMLQRLADPKKIEIYL